MTTMSIVALEDRDWFREESKGALWGGGDGSSRAPSTTSTVPPAFDPGRRLTRSEITWALVAATIQCFLLAADEIGWFDVPLI